jgi:hypothetical protein
VRRPNNRLKVKRLFVLGAGASYRVTSASGLERQAPLDRDFCQRIMDVNAIRPTWVADCRDFIRNEWKDHKPFASFGLEQAVLRQLGHLEFIDAIQPRRRKTSLTSYEYMNHLSHVICFILRRAKENANGAYARFADSVLPAGVPWQDVEDRVITFNYDDLFEKHLFGRYSIRQIYFDKLLDTQNDRVVRHERFPNPLVIKLHGSVNWRCSTEDFERIINGPANGESPETFITVWFSRRSTPSPADSSSPLIMPPLPVKPLTQIGLFRFLWTRAYEYLHEAQELVICGYSLPEADRMAQSMFANFRNPSLGSITVVDPNPEMLSKWRSLLRRRNINPNVQWKYFEDFDDYVRSL